MEITISELEQLTRGTPIEATLETTKSMFPIGELVLIRTRISGVSIGRLVEANYEGTQFKLNQGRRIWRWTGDALACSDLASGKGKCQMENHPEGFIVVATDGAEIIPMTEAAFLTLTGAATYGPKS